MKKETQDKIWSVMTWADRREFQDIYLMAVRNAVDDRDKADVEMYEAIFGKHNLTGEDVPEEKELNLAKLLNGCEGEKIFLVDEGERVVDSVNDTEVVFRDGITIGTVHFTGDSLYIQPTGFAYAYPSRESFLANPLNARKAWEEWAEEHKPKRWRAKEGGAYYAIEVSGSILHATEEFTKVDARRNNFGNYFKTEALANEAASHVRDLLAKFHENHPQV